AGALWRLAELMHAQVERLAELMTREQGKPLAEARGEIAYAASFIEQAAGEAVRVHGEILPASQSSKRLLVLRQPVGVTAAITPWNFPTAMITRKLGPALAAGCTMIVKPAEQTPLSALALGALCLEAGLPAGVVNIVVGDAPAVGAALLQSPVVRVLSFTGSTEVGKLLMRGAADTVKRLSLELGGHAPLIVFDDADVEAAVAGTMAAKFRNAGQTCISPNRFFVQQGIYDRYVARLQQAMSEQLRLGHGLDDGVTVGPLIDDDGLAKVRAHIENAVAGGATLRTGGDVVRPREGLCARFIAPTILEDIDPTMRVSCEETFGPVVPVCRFSDEDEVIAAANNTPYGLAAYFFTRDAARLMRVSERLEYGIIGANEGAVSTAQAPFGGVKQSGFGREGGRYVMDEYTEIKYVCWGGH
ncbi:MAG: NAD-dependent succinate-semialdehyde dehydrogenase, partial [Myxococcales bacterium]|nr:NAD-dependent succinate-semialdehyde dehydrogenase [Myxococcales bacterium]